MVPDTFSFSVTSVVFLCGPPRLRVETFEGRFRFGGQWREGAMTRRRVIACVAALACLGGLAVVDFSFLEREKIRTDHNTYERIQAGMTLDEVEALLGGPEGDYTPEKALYLENVDSMPTHIKRLLYPPQYCLDMTDVAELEAGCFCGIELTYAERARSGSVAGRPARVTGAIWTDANWGSRSGVIHVGFDAGGRAIYKSFWKVTHSNETLFDRMKKRLGW
jgi:hypothetical protein